MITDDLFNTVLIRPITEGANKLHIVSGYATSAMAFHHLQYLYGMKHQIQVKLIVGMCVRDGLSLSNHKGFQQLMHQDFTGCFECSYLLKSPPVHSKVYLWFKDEVPVCCFVGSANYTQTAFGISQRETMTTSATEPAIAYFESLIPQTIYCTHNEAQDFVQIYNDNYNVRLKGVARFPEQEKQEIHAPAQDKPNWIGLPVVSVNLLDRSGNLPQRSGLNWGQRPEVHREPNQAYIKLPSTICNSDFFPARGIDFTVLTDDDKVLICKRAQDNGKAIHTPHNNSLIGEYFRNRLGVTNGAPVLLDDLLRYGRTAVDFYKIDDETYYMDFSIPVGG